MQALSIELEDETVSALEAERELFGFESRQAYVRWIIEHRGSIEAERRRGTGQGQGRETREEGADRGRKRDRLLADHDERIARLEDRVATLSRALEEANEGDVTRADDGSTSTDDRDGDGDGARSKRERRTAETTASREPILEVRGSPRTVRQGPDSRVRSSESEPDDGETDGDADESSRRAPGEGSDPSAASAPSSRDGDADRDSSADAAESTASDAESSPLTPERVARIREDPVHEDAGVLGNVEAERLDELSRRAVATTRKRLNRDVQTGLEYTSSTRLAGDGLRPGEDITDLDALSIPGRSEETVEKRRNAVGRALAFLRDEGRARRSDFVDALYEECPAGYDTTDGWWRCIKEGLKQVDAVDGGEGTRVWRYRG